MEIVFTVLIMVFAGFYFKSGYELCIASVGKVTSGMKVSLSFLNSAQPICAILIFIYGVETLIAQIRELTRKCSNGGENEC